MTHASPDQSGPRPEKKSFKRFGCTASVMLLVTMLIVLLGIGRSMWDSEPDYWVLNQRFLTQTPTDKLTGLADQAFNRFVAELSESRGYRHVGNDNGQVASAGVTGVRTIRLSFDETNAWLNQRLDDWLVNRGKQLPAGISEPMLAGRDGKLVVAVRVKREELDTVVSVIVSLRFTDDGRAVLVLDGGYIGRLPLPVKTFLDRFSTTQEGTDTRLAQAIAFFQAQEPFDPILPIDGSRRARIIGLEVGEEGLSLTLQAEPNGEDP